MFFLTFTMNPYWADYQTVKWGSGMFDESVISAFIFKTKQMALMKFSKHHEILGKVSAFVWRIEYHKSGLHRLISFLERLWIRKAFTSSKWQSTSDIQKILHFLNVNG
jgi:hypothetical protein